MADNLHLLRLAKDGDMAARDELVTANTALVVSAARRYVGRGQELEDLVQIGMIGLIKAIDRFDLDYEVKLSTYALPLIQGEIRRFLRDDGMVRVSRSLKTIYYRAEKYRNEAVKLGGTEPSVDEISKAISVAPEELVMAMEAAAEVSGIDELQEQAAGSEAGDRLVDRLYIDQMLDRLSDTERRLIAMRYFDNRTQAQTGKSLGMSQVKVSRLEKSILEKLRAME